MTIKSPTCWNQTKGKASVFVEILARDGNCCSIQKATSKTWIKRGRYKTCYIQRKWMPLCYPQGDAIVQLGMEVPLTLAQHRAIRLPAVSLLPSPVCWAWLEQAGFEETPSSVLCGRAAGLWAQGWPQSCLLGHHARPARRQGSAGQRGAQVPDTVNLISHPQQHTGAGHHLPGEQCSRASSTAFFCSIHLGGEQHCSLMISNLSN